MDNDRVSIIIPARNEVYLEKTIRNVLQNAEGDIEIIAILDGYIPDPSIDTKDERVKFIHFEKSIGQRAACNRGVEQSTGKYIMKLDAHCSVDKGFDVKLKADCEYDWTVIPTMYNLDITTWKPKLHKKTNYMYFTSMDSDKPFRPQYYEGRTKDNKQREPKNDKMIDDILCCMGPGWFMHKDRFLEQGGCDERHVGGWGMQSIEVSLKAWLSGGKLVVNKKTWFAHWFRGGGGPGFPYPISGNQQEMVRKYSQDLWLNNKWEGQRRPLCWLIKRFSPVPSWTDDEFSKIKSAGEKFGEAYCLSCEYYSSCKNNVSINISKNDLTILYYTANAISKGIEYSVLRSLRGHRYPIVSVSQEPMDLGKNIVVPKEVSLINIYRQVLIGAKEATTKYVVLCEDDCLYVPEHFTYRPTKPFAYNLNRWMLHYDWDNPVFGYRKRPVLSQCIADREELIKAIEARLALPEPFDGEPGFKDGLPYETFETRDPNLVICHKNNTSGRRYIGHDLEPRTELQPWGTVDYWVKKFDSRKGWK
jgi:glycosyltransferase involved in cell wall biosynthesis